MQEVKAIGKNLQSVRRQTGKNEGKAATTLYEVIERFEFATYLKLNLKTGRTHQIRVHLSGINHPVFGDETYGGRKIVYGINS